MRSHSLVPRLVTTAVVMVAIVLAVLPFHATLTVFVTQFVGHYTLLRLWKELLLVPLAAVAVYIGLTRPAIRQQVLGSKLFWLTITFSLVQAAWGILALLLGNITLKALGYGWVVDIRFLVFFVSAWVVGLASPKLARWWPFLVFIPAALVVLIGLLQYFILPYDVMKYLGYSSATIFPYEDINHSVQYIRVMSTLRGANPLGAYLVLVVCLWIAWAGRRFVKPVGRRSHQQLILSGLYGILGVLVLVLTFSRGAWIGLVVSVVVLAWLVRRHLPVRLVALVLAVLGVLTVGFALLAFVVRDPTVQNIVLHTQDHSAIATTSDAGHSSGLQMGLHDLLHEPLGRGPGTAGPASAYNTGHPVRIAENYIVQIGQETGWIGIALFIAILGTLAYMLYRRRRQTLPLGLLAALAGLTVVGLTSHVWADDTLAYVYWGLAGLACAMPITDNKKSAD